jgi:hypothetical protein
MLAEPPAELGDRPLLGSLPAMARFSKRKRHHSPVAKLLKDAPELAEMARSIANCANSLQVLLELPEGGDPFAMLTGYNPCNRRVCPMCEWRRSMVWRGRLLSGLDAFFEKHPKHRAIFATFTIRNVPVGDLGAALKEMHASWKRLTKCSFFPSAYWFRRTEVTLNHVQAPLKVTQVASSSTEVDDLTRGEGWGPVMAHPHIHSLLLVPARYFGPDYIRQTEWQRQWMMAARLDYVPVVDVRRARATFTTAESFYDARAAGIEAMKYATKATDLVKLKANLPEFVHQIRGHRLVSMSKALADFVPEHDPTAAEMGDDRIAGLPQLHPAVACLAQWDHSIQDYNLRPLA